MPDEVIQGGVAAQDKWLEEQRHQLDSHIHILAPIEKKIQYITIIIKDLRI